MKIVGEAKRLPYNYFCKLEGVILQKILPKTRVVM